MSATFSCVRSARRTTWTAGRALGRSALRWAQHCYPEPHTQDEADAHERGRVEDRSRLVQILGYDPDA